MFNHITWCSETNLSSVKNYTLVQKFANDIFVTNKLIIQSFFSGYYLLCSNDYIFFFLNDCIVNTMSIYFFKSFLHHQSFTKLVLLWGKIKMYAQSESLCMELSLLFSWAISHASYNITQRRFTVDLDCAKWW